MKADRPHCSKLIALSALLAQWVPFARAQEVSAAPAPGASAQAAAVRKYPALGVAGSAFNREFVARVQSAREGKPGFFDDPKWPLLLADEVARALTVAPVETVPVDWYAGQSAETFSKLPPAQRKLDREALDFPLLAAAIFHATNAARGAQRLRPLIYLSALQEAALEHSTDMATRGFFSHQNPHDPAKATASLRLEAKGITNMAMGENISSLVAEEHTYWTYARAVVTQWMKSPGHRANILGANYTHLGCGACACRCPNFHMLATQNFVFMPGQ